MRVRASELEAGYCYSQCLIDNYPFLFRAALGITFEARILCGCRGMCMQVEMIGEIFSYEAII